MKPLTLMILSNKFSIS